MRAGVRFPAETGMSPRYGVQLVPVVKQPDYEADHWPSSNAKLKMRGVIPPLLPYAFMAWFSKHRDKFTLPQLST